VSVQLTIERAAFVRLVRLLHHHDIHCSSKMRGDGIDSAQQSTAPIKHRALQRQAAGREAMRHLVQGLPRVLYTQQEEDKWHHFKD